MPGQFASFAKRFTAFADKSAFILTAPAVAMLYYIDPGMAKTLLQWIVFGPVLVGLALLVTRIAFPHIRFMDLVDEVHMRGCRGSAMLASSLIIFVAIVMLAFAIYAKA